MAFQKPTPMSKPFPYITRLVNEEAKKHAITWQLKSVTDKANRELHRLKKEHILNAISAKAHTIRGYAEPSRKLHILWTLMTQWTRLTLPISSPLTLYPWTLKCRKNKSLLSKCYVVLMLMKRRT
ncbi:unnamed protein product [Caenorhabditis nigoni]